MNETEAKRFVNDLIEGAKAREFEQKNTCYKIWYKTVR